ncbi:cation:proton antiporter [Streptohalobacillus salinus]
MMFEPITEPVIIFAIAVLIFLITPILMKKLHMPGIVGPILAGVMVGPYGLNLLARDATIELLGTVGLLFIIFIAGLELDIEGFMKYRHRSLIFGLLSFGFPLILGFSVGIVFQFSIPASLLLGSIVGSHTLLSYPIASKMGISKNKAIITTVGGTLVTDVLAMLFLAVISGMSVGQVNAYFWLQLILSTGIYALLIFLLVPFLTKHFFKIDGLDGASEFNYVLVILFVSGWMALYAGLEPIIGAFLAGLSLNRYIFSQGSLMNRIDFTANALFIPFFLLSVGMLMDVTALFASVQSIMLTFLITFSLFIGKSGAAFLSAKLFNYSKTESLVILGLTIPQAAATLAATLVGFDLNLINQNTVNAIIIMILISTIVGPSLTEKYGRRLVKAQTETEPDPEKRPERILIPIANPHTMEALMDLGFLVRASLQSDEPLYPLKVIKNHAKQAEADVATAEKMLGHAMFYAAGAEVPIRPLTRISLSVGKGIERAITEERITTVISGWKGPKTHSEKVFGGVIDNVIDHTYIRHLIVKETEPIQMTKRLVVILPKQILYKPGFKDAIRITKNIIKQLNCTVLYIVMDDDFEATKSVIEEIKPINQLSFTHLPDWEMLERYCLKLAKQDLVMAISARQGTIGWHPSLENLPRKLSDNVSQNFIIFYPFENYELDLRGQRKTPMSVISATYHSD